MSDENSAKTKATLVFVLILIFILYLPLMNIVKMFMYPTMPNWMLIVGVALVTLVAVMMLIHSSAIVTTLTFMSLFSNDDVAKELFIKSRSKPKVKRN